MSRYKKRADGRYCARISTGQYNENGNPIRISVYGRTEAELNRKIAEVRMSIMTDSIILNPDTYFIDYANNWLKVSKMNRSIKTQDMYASIIKNHTEYLAFKKLKDIKQTHIQEQINRCSEHPRTCQQLKITIKQIFDSAMLDGLVNKNPCFKIELPRRVVHQKRALTKAEKNAIKEAELDIKHRAFLDLLYYTGMRPAEVYALTWSDINFRTETIKVCKSITFKKEEPIVTYPKTDSGIRTIEAPSILFKTLNEFRKDNNRIVLFNNGAAGYMKRSACYNMWDVCKAAIEEVLGYKTEISAYYCRHNYATMLYYSHISIKEAVRLMGHSDSAMIMKVYSHLDSEQEDTRNKLNSIAF